MSKKEKLQNRYSTLNIYLGTLLASLVAVIGFLISKFESISSIVLVIGIFGVFIICAGILMVQSLLNSINDEIGDL